MVYGWYKDTKNTQWERSISSANGGWKSYIFMQKDEIGPLPNITEESIQMDRQDLKLQQNSQVNMG